MHTPVQCISASRVEICLRLGSFGSPVVPVYILAALEVTPVPVLGDAIVYPPFDLHLSHACVGLGDRQCSVLATVQCQRDVGGMGRGWLHYKQNVCMHCPLQARGCAQSMCVRTVHPCHIPQPWQYGHPQSQPPSHLDADGSSACLLVQLALPCLTPPPAHTASST